MGRTIEAVTAQLWNQAQLWEPRGRGQRYKDRFSPQGIFGGYFEHLVARILGGDVLFNAADTADHRPDIFDKTTKTWRESKSIRAGHHPDLVIAQTDAYRALAETESVEYMFTRHRVQETSVSKPTAEIFQRAAASPKIGLVIPFSIVGAALDRGWPFSNVYPRYGKGCYTLASSLLGGLIETPEPWIDRIGLDRESFSYEIFRTPELVNLGYRVKPFFFRYIREKE